MHSYTHKEQQRKELPCSSERHKAEENITKVADRIAAGERLKHGYSTCPTDSWRPRLDKRSVLREEVYDSVSNGFRTPWDDDIRLADFLGIPKEKLDIHHFEGDGGPHSLLLNESDREFLTRKLKPVVDALMKGRKTEAVNALQTMWEDLNQSRSRGR